MGKRSRPLVRGILTPARACKDETSRAAARLRLEERQSYSRTMHRVHVALFLVVAAFTPPRALAYRDLTSCPDLTPLEPVPVVTADGRRCARTIAEASGRYVRRTLAAHAACLRRAQAGEVAGDPRVRCRGLVRLSTGAFDLPTDPATGAAVGAAAADLVRAIGGGCTDAGALAIGGCAGAAAGLAGCVLAEQRDHVLDVLDQQFGDATPTADPAARSCQRALDRASRSYLARVMRTYEHCLRRHDDASGVHRADRCLGAVRRGSDAAPGDAATAVRLARARVRLVDAVTRACTADAVGRLDACGTDPAGLASCLGCVLRRESLLLVQARHGGVADRPTTHFVDWGALTNPILQDPDRLMKNQAIVYHDGWFWVVAPSTLRRTRDFLTYEPIDVPGGHWFGDVSRIDGRWYQTTNGGGGDQLEIFARTSTDFLAWSPLGSITPGLSAHPIIDGALVAHGGYVFLAFKDRAEQLPYVTRSVTGSVDGAWLPPARAIAGVADPTTGFAEAFHFLEIDGRVRIVGTGRDPEPYRCIANPFYVVFTCSHEPFIFTLPAPTADLATWTTWRHKTHLRVPYEAWNPVMHANSGQLADWRAHDGFFYLSYAGSLDGERFDFRGHGKIGLARSRDLVHWRVAGDLRD
jgi:hypothetical protein